MEVDPAAVKANRRALPTMSLALARSCPRSRLCSRQSAREQGWQPTRRHLVPTVVPVHASQVDVTDLAAPILMAEPVSQQSVAGAARYLMRLAVTGAVPVHSAVCYHGPDRLQPGQLVAGGGIASGPHPRLPVSTVPTPLRRHVPTGLAAEPCLAARPRHSGIPHCVRSAGAALPAGGCQHQAGQPQVSAAVSVQTDGHGDQLGVSPDGQPPGLL